MKRARRIRDEVCTFHGTADPLAPTLSPEQDEGLGEAIDEADRGDLVDGAAAFTNVRGRLRDAG